VSVSLEELSGTPCITHPYPVLDTVPYMVLYVKSSSRTETRCMIVLFARRLEKVHFKV